MTDEVKPSIIEQILDRFAFVQSVNIDTYLDLPITVTEPEFRAAISRAWSQGFVAGSTYANGGALIAKPDWEKA